MAIETNELIDVKTLSPFKRFIMTIGNLPTSYLESMTYGEMLMWFCNYLQETVIPTVNNNAEAVEELQNLYEELKQYVDDYFENLDVQTEINAKLDSMVQDGSLEQLIGVYVDNVIQPQINTQNNQIASQNTKISQIETKVNSVASGSPLVASSTSGMTDTERVYVNTTDGKWYYYDGDSWEIGGDYQSTGIADGGVKFFNLDNYLTENMFGWTTDVSTLGWRLSNYQDAGYRSSSPMLIKKGTTITVSDDFVANYHWNLKRITGFYQLTNVMSETTDTSYTLLNDEYCVFSYRPIDNNWQSETYTVSNSAFLTSSDITSLKYYYPLKKGYLLEDIDSNLLRNTLYCATLDGGLKRFYLGVNTLGLTTQFKSSVPIKFHVPSGYKYGIETWNNKGTMDTENFVSDSGWMTEDYILPANKWFTITLRKTDSSAFDDLEAAKNIITMTSYADFSYTDNKISELISEVGDYNYNGEKIDFQNKYGYDIDTLMSYNTSANSQGFAINNGYLVQLYNGGTLIINDLSDGTEVGTISNLGFSHGDTCQFSNVKYDADDMFPLLYVTSDLTPSIVYIIRIVNTTTASNIKSYNLGSEAGYYAGHCFDFENNILYSFGYKNNDFQTTSNDNCLIISSYDMSKETLISGTEYSLELIERYEKPFIYCIQGQKFFKGKCFLISSYNPAVQASKIYVYDPIRKLYTSIFNELPSSLANSECEDLEFLLNTSGTAYDLIIGNRSTYYKLSFK